MQHDQEHIRPGSSPQRSHPRGLLLKSHCTKEQLKAKPTRLRRIVGLHHISYRILQIATDVRECQESVAAVLERTEVNEHEACLPVLPMQSAAEAAVVQVAWISPAKLSFGSTAKGLCVPIHEGLEAFSEGGITNVDPRPFNAMLRSNCLLYPNHDIRKRNIALEQHRDNRAFRDIRWTL
jgi:hypothetical protein